MAKYDPYFEMKLRNGLFKTAYDIVAKRFVEIHRVEQNHQTGQITIIASKESDGVIEYYSPTELTDYCL